MPGGVGPLVALQEGGLGGGDDLFGCSCGYCCGEVGGAGEGLGQLAFDVFGDLAPASGEEAIAALAAAA